MAQRKPKSYPTWLKAWRKSGSPKYPQTAMLVFVHWTDAAMSEDDHGTIETWVVGFLKDATDDHVALAMEAFEDGDTRTHLTVPAGMVNSIATLGSITLKKRDA